MSDSHTSLRRHISQVLRSIELRTAPFLFDHIAPSRFIRATYGYAPKPKGEIDIQTEGFTFRVRPSKSNVDAALFFHGIYEAGTNMVIHRLLDNGGVFWDVGGYIGVMSALASRFADEVHTFEPHPENLARLRHTVSTNALTITVHPFGLGDTEGTSQITRPGDEAAERMTLEGIGQTVQVRTIDQVATEVSLPEVIKIDVEGWEARVLAGGTKVLSRSTAPAIILESSQLINSEDASAAIEILRDVNDYSFYVLARGKESRSRLIPLTRLPRHDNVFCLLPHHDQSLRILR